MLELQAFLGVLVDTNLSTLGLNYLGLPVLEHLTVDTTCSDRFHHSLLNEIPVNVEPLILIRDI